MFLTDKLPQPNYEKRANRKNNSFTDDKNELPDIKLNQRGTISKKKSEKKSDKANNDNKSYNEDVQARQSSEKIISISRNVVNSEENKNNMNGKILDQDLQVPKKRRKIENNDRSLDNLINQNIYNSAIGGIGNSNNIKVVKSENYDGNNSLIIKDKSPKEESPKNKKKNKENIMLPNIKNQNSYDLR